MAVLICRDKWRVARACALVGIVGLLLYWLVVYLSQPKVSTTDIFVDCETNFTSEEGAVFIPEESILKEIRTLDLICLYQRYITNIQTVCPRKERLGGLGPGGWDICVTSNYLTAPCLVYSLGINYNFLFDDSIAKKYGCEVHSFDPTMDVEEHDHSLHVHFHPSALSTVNNVDSEGRQLKTLEEVRLVLHHQQRVIDVMKMDIGSAEWSVLEHILQTNQLGAIRQLVVEFHDFQVVNGDQVFSHGSQRQHIRQLQILKQLYNAGFRIFYTETNTACKFKSTYGPMWSSCHRVSLTKQTAKQNGFLVGWLK